MSEASSSYKYGSVNNAGGDVEAESHDFKETDLLYYREKELSKQEKLMKIVKIAVPLIIAVTLIGGFAWFLLGDFGHLYPGPAGSQVPGHTPASLPTSSAPKAPAPRSAPEEAPPPAPAPKYEVHAASTSSSSSGGSSCTAHSKCSALGLTGQCCPTSAGTILECC